MEFILDLAKWRCGGSGGYGKALGTGDTELHNFEGYQCCLGQFILQTYKGFITIKDIEGVSEPADVLRLMSYDTDNLFIKEEGFNSILSIELIKINDDPTTTIENKIESIREILAKRGHTLTVINDNRFNHSELYSPEQIETLKMSLNTNLNYEYNNKNGYSFNKELTDEGYLGEIEKVEEEDKDNKSSNNNNDDDDPKSNGLMEFIIVGTVMLLIIWLSKILIEL